jgi:hypothetical protein
MCRIGASQTTKVQQKATKSAHIVRSTREVPASDSSFVSRCEVGELAAAQDCNLTRQLAPLAEFDNSVVPKTQYVGDVMPPTTICIRAGIETEIGCHSFRATGITAYLKNGGWPEIVQQMAAHESAKRPASRAE